MDVVQLHDGRRFQRQHLDMLESVLLYGHSLSTCRLPRLHREVVTNALLPFLELQRIRMAPLAADGSHTQLPTSSVRNLSVQLLM